MSLRALPLAAQNPTRRHCAPGLHWFVEIAVLQVGSGVVRLEADETERAVVVLSGTHDLAAGAGTWGSRGLRETPYAGRPCAVFVPPQHEFAAQGGPGELLIVAVRRAVDAAPEPARRPLLPLAGSNKVFDPQAGGWQRLEDLPDTPEALLPRRIERRELGGCLVEAVFPPEYKARALSLLETVVPPGHVWLAPPRPVHAREELLYVRSAGGATVVADGNELGIGIESAVPLAARTHLELHAGATPCYVVLAAGGPKGTT